MQPRADGAGGPVRLAVVAGAGAIALGAPGQSWRFSAVAAAFVLLYLAAERAPGRPLAAVPGAALLAWRMWPAHQTWARLALFAVVVVAAAVVPDLERRWQRTGAVPLLALLSAGGVYACVPETGQMRFVAGACVIVAAGELLARQRVGPGLALALTALVAWAVVYGGTYRESALVGGFASLGLLLGEPVVRRLPGPRRPLLRGRWLPLLALLALQAGYALLVGRTAGLRHDAGPALGLAVPMAAGLGVAARLLLGPPAATGRASID